MSISSPYSLANLVFAQATRHPDRMAIATLEDAVNYGRLRILIINCAMHMKRHGINRSSCLALDIEYPLTAICLSVACSLVGCGWVHATKAAEAQTHFLVTHVLHDGARQYMGPGDVVAVTPDWFSPPPGSNRRMRQAFEGYATPHDTWMIAQSSGTSGVPKFMAYDEALTWRRSTEVTAAVLPENPVMVCLFHPLSPPGMNWLLRVLAAGGGTIFGYFRDFSDRVHVDCVFGAPNHFMVLLDGMPPPPVRIPIAITAGSAASKPFLARLLQYFEAVRYVYASSEAGIVCNEVITDSEILDDNVSVGGPLPGVTVQIVDTDGTPRPAGAQGLIRVRSGCQVAGYLGNPRATEDIFHDGWFYPGDLGFLSAAGTLHVTGRANDQLNIGGVKLSPEVLDEVLQSLPNVRDGACFTEQTPDGFDRLAAVLVPAGPQGPSRAARNAHRAVLERLGTSMTPRAFYIVDAIPRNQNGKLTRHLLAEAVRGQQAILVNRP